MLVTRWFNRNAIKDAIKVVFLNIIITTILQINTQSAADPEQTESHIDQRIINHNHIISLQMQYLKVYRILSYRNFKVYTTFKYRMFRYKDNEWCWEMTVSLQESFNNV